jgi:hypothetical protein
VAELVVDAVVGVVAGIETTVVAAVERDTVAEVEAQNRKADAVEEEQVQSNWVDVEEVEEWVEVEVGQNSKG